MYYSTNNLDCLNHIYTIDTLTTGYALSFLNFIFFLSIFLAMLVIISKNPVISVLYLIGLFFNIACYLILMGISFIGLSYLLVYVGAVSILFLFILMLINVRVSELTTENTNSIPLILTIPIFFSYSVQYIWTTITLNTYGSNTYNNNALFNNLYNILFYTFKSNYEYDKTNNILYVTSNIWDGYISSTTHIASIGSIMYSSYSIWLLITSIILLLSMVGAIVITLKK